MVPTMYSDMIATKVVIITNQMHALVKPITGASSSDEEASLSLESSC